MLWQGDGLAESCRVIGLDQRDLFRRSVRGGHVHEFAESGHFAQLEEPEAYTELVSRLARA